MIGDDYALSTKNCLIQESNSQPIAPEAGSLTFTLLNL